MYTCLAQHRKRCLEASKYVLTVCRYATPVVAMQPQLKGKKKKKKHVSPPVVIPPTPTSPLVPPLPPILLQGPIKTTPTSPGVSRSLPWPSFPVVGQKLECVVVQVNSPGDFFIQPASYTTEILPLLTKVPLHQPSRQSWSVGERCLATFNGEKWYRAEVVGIVDSTAGSVKFEVEYKDFGNRAVLSSSELAIMPPALDHYPAQAVKASLAGVQPLGKTWDHVTSMYFSNMVLEKHVTVTVQVHCMHIVSRGLNIVSLFYCDSSRNVCTTFY